MAGEMSLTHTQLIDLAYKWVLKETRCKIAFKEFKTWPEIMEVPDIISFGPNGKSIVIECKASRADFLADRQKPFRIIPENGMGSERYFLCEENVITKSDLPEGWGLIWILNENGLPWACYEPDVVGCPHGFFHAFKNLKNERALMFSALAKLGRLGKLNDLYREPKESGAKFTGPTLAVKGQIWRDKRYPNQKFEIMGAGTNSIVRRSLKTLSSDHIPSSKFYAKYEVDRD